MTRKAKKHVGAARKAHGALCANRCRALCKLERWAEAREAAATLRDVDPSHAAGVVGGARAALGLGDATGPEWDPLRAHALSHPEDHEARALVARWEELRDGLRGDGRYGF